MTESAEYLLGTNDSELDRLGVQHAIWRDLAEAVLDRAGVGPGMTVLDLGCGPGFVTEELARRVGPSGRVVALDESPRWHEVLRARDFAAPVELVQAKIQEADLGEDRFDAVFSRWVFSFFDDLDSVCSQVQRALRPGGRLVVQDYNHEGVSVFPKSAGFEAVIRATREYYRRAGGNSWVMGSLPAAAKRAGLTLTELHPNVMVGGNQSPVFQWLDVFFPRFSGTFLEEDLITVAEQAQFLTEWAALKTNPDALFYSPMVVDMIATRES
jgi:ubiquinone/menaquinone biosynthesis C-methylase UbiE